MSIFDCPIQGLAIITRHADESVTWQQSDTEIHIAPNLLDEDGAVEFIEQRYVIGEQCPHADAIHARLRGDAA